VGLNRIQERAEQKLLVRTARSAAGPTTRTKRRT